MSNKLKLILGCVFLCSVVNNANARTNIKTNTCKIIYAKSNKVIHSKKKSKSTKVSKHSKKLLNKKKPHRNKLHHHLVRKHSLDYMNGIASYYSPKFVGAKTASGDNLNMHELTAAHPLLPLGSKVKVTNLANNKSIYVVINDRMPKRSGHVIDLTTAGAKQLGMYSSGISHVNLELISNNEFQQYKMKDEASLHANQINLTESLNKLNSSESTHLGFESQSK
ncbi:MAG: hypothetical protein RLZZ293_790 [Pseudomonadota bacterium]|jgi:rare lipoprotein A